MVYSPVLLAIPPDFDNTAKAECSFPLLPSPPPRNSTAEKVEEVVVVKVVEAAVARVVGHHLALVVNPQAHPPKGAHLLVEVVEVQRNLYLSLGLRVARVLRLRMGVAVEKVSVSHLAVSLRDGRKAVGRGVKFMAVGESSRVLLSAEFTYQRTLHRSYGSGYPGVSSSRGVGGFGFPFYFWPVVWGGAAGAGGGAYLHTSEVRHPFYSPPKLQY